MDFTKLFPGYKTYAAAIGLAVLALLQFRGGDSVSAAQSLMGALAAIGLRSAIAAQTPAQPNQPAPQPQLQPQPVQTPHGNSIAP